MSAALAHLADLDYEAKRRKHPDLPVHALPKPSFRDGTSNDLTHAVLRCIELHGGYAVRINTQGQYNEKLGKWTAGTTRKGTADIHAIYKGLHLSIEIKVGRDRISDDQQNTAKDVERAGGQYYVARDFTGFLTWFESLAVSFQGGKVANPL